MGLVLHENLPFSLTPQFIEVLIGPRLVLTVSTVFDRSKKPLKRFEILASVQHPTERGVLMRTSLAYASQWVDIKSTPYAKSNS
jgi:hypothetical protein